MRQESCRGLPIFIFYKTSYKYFFLFPPPPGKTTQHSLCPSVREKLAGQILNSHIKVASLCTLPSGREMEMESAVRAISSSMLGAVFLLKAPREGVLATLPCPTGHCGTIRVTFTRTAGTFWSRDSIKLSPEKAMVPTYGQHYGANAFQTQD